MSNYLICRISGIRTTRYLVNTTGYSAGYWIPEIPDPLPTLFGISKVYNLEIEFDKIPFDLIYRYLTFLS